jgi:hypothetical protein
MKTPSPLLPESKIREQRQLEGVHTVIKAARAINNGDSRRVCGSYHGQLLTVALGPSVHWDGLMSYDHHRRCQSIHSDDVCNAGATSHNHQRMKYQQIEGGSSWLGSDKVAR